MLYFIIAWTFLTVICFLIGIGLLNAFKADCFERIGDRFIVAVWLGVVVLSISLLAASSVFPLSPLVGIAIAVTLVALSLLLQGTRTEIVALRSILSPGLIWGFLTLEVLIAALTTKQVTWLDTGLYHFGAIRWLSRYGAVPGIALLLQQFGFTSSWFALAAPLNPDIFADRVTAVTNGFVFLIAVLHFLICLAHTCTNSVQFSDWFGLIFSSIILPFTVASNLMSVILISPSPDFPVIFFTEIVSWTILIVSNHRTSYPTEGTSPIVTAQAIPLILSAGAVTMKLTALPILFIAGLFYVFGGRLSGQRLLTGCVITVLLLLPMFIFGIITSGCPLYPSSFLCLDLPWSPSVQDVKEVAENTRGWGTWFGTPPPGSIPVLWLFWQWFNATVLNKLITLLIIISTLFAIHIARVFINSRIRGQLWIMALGFSGMTFMMLKAPIIRFGLGYLLLLPALSLAIYCQTKLTKNLQVVFHRYSLYYLLRRLGEIRFALPLFFFTLALVIFVNTGAESRLLLPPQLQKVEFLQRRVNDVTYFSPKNPTELCWSTELPCAFTLKENIRLRDPSQGIRAGFIHVR